MNNSIMVHYAVACLEGLQSPASPEELCRSQHVPLKDGLAILWRFQSAGIVRQNNQGLFERVRDIEELTALDILQALWSRPGEKSVRVLYGNNAEALTRQLNRIGALNG